MISTRLSLAVFILTALFVSPPAADEAAAPVCGLAAPPNQEIYRILWNDPDGKRQRLWISRFPKYAIVVFRSEAAADRDWARDLTALESVTFRKSAPSSGILSIRSRDPDDSLEVGPIPRSCWDGLRHHLGRRVLTYEADD